MKKKLVLSALFVFSVAMFAPAVVSAVNSNNTVVELPVNDNDKKEKKSKKKAKKSEAKECSEAKKSSCCGK